MTAALLPRSAAFEQLGGAMAARGQAPGVERGVVILGADGEPFAWAGRHRFVPARATVELRAVITPFYVSLEARRQTQARGTAAALARGAGRGLVSVAGAAGPRARAGEPVLARAVLSADAGCVQRLRGVAGGAGAGAAARGGAGVAPRDRAALVDRVRGGGPGARRPVPGALFRSRHRAPRRRGEPARAHRLLGLVAGRRGRPPDGAGGLGGGPGGRDR